MKAVVNVCRRLNLFELRHGIASKPLFCRGFSSTLLDQGLSRDISLGDQSKRQYSSTTTVNVNNGRISKAREVTEVASDIPENQYHIIADATFDQLLEYLSPVEDSEDLDDVDINFSQGVMAIKLGPGFGTWVINKQTPNRQIWWSSPISGPMRFELSEELSVEDAMKEEDCATIVSRWKCTKDGSDLLNRLRDELLEEVKIDIFEDS